MSKQAAGLIAADPLSIDIAALTVARKPVELHANIFNADYERAIQIDAVCAVWELLNNAAVYGKTVEHWHETISRGGAQGHITRSVRYGRPVGLRADILHHGKDYNHRESHQERMRQTPDILLFRDLSCIHGCRQSEQSEQRCGLSA
jgi:hypothetical protein